uniref:NADH-ubiquinone oxidoreductase chain 3 n=1 Tax=Pneumocystis carinii TaxID=4754 RepID=D2XDV8_PNECA|nr:NADH dehydrogenase subunit 3 [Pneumocystis carinii]ACZ82948.1 NADH dehydrogenase subunit 3 [Pneumocystis carinii]AFR90433.1 NADH dehydrogenase subunit 3 [Pneumocystis carinii]
MQILVIVTVAISLSLIILNVLLAKTSPTLEKVSPFECGFSSFHQTRSPFNIYYYLIGLLFLIFDLEILLIYPYALFTTTYGFYIFNIFLIFLTIGFIYEFGKGVLKFKTHE